MNPTEKYLVWERDLHGDLVESAPRSSVLKWVRQCTPLCAPIDRLEKILIKLRINLEV